MNILKKYGFIVVAILAFILCFHSWPAIADFKAKEIQPIASAISTISGMLFGFVMASISLFASAKDNRLIRNTTLTGYLPRLVTRLHITMGALLLVCLIFVIVLFVPDTATFQVGNPPKDYRYSTVVVIVGIFFLLNTFWQFALCWHGFRDIAKHM